MVTDPHKVLYVLNSLVAWGGVERTTYDEIRFLRSHGLEIELLVLRAIGKEAEIFREAGFQVHVIHAYQEDPRPGKHNHYSLRGLWQIRKLLRRGRFGIIVGTQPPSSYLARLACWPRRGRRLIAIERTKISSRSRIYRLADRVCSWWTDLVICVSHQVRDGLIEYCQLNPRRLQVIEHGYALRDLTVEPFQHPKLADRFVFGCVSRLTATKRQDILLQAFARVHQEHPATALLLVGGGDAEDEFRQLTTELGLDEAVVFTGEVSDPSPHYRAMDVFTFPTISEGLGGVFVEAWLSGLPLICSDLRPMADYVVCEKNGLLVRPDNPEALALAMVRLLEHPELARQLAEGGQATALERFDFQVQVGKLYEALTGHPIPHK